LQEDLDNIKFLTILMRFIYFPVFLKNMRVISNDEALV
jgi:hypothetical protein